MKQFCFIFFLLLCQQMWAQSDYDDLMAAMIAAKIHQDSIDVSSVVVVYNYTCQTQDADGQPVTDSMKVALQIGSHCTRSYPYRKFCEDTEEIDYLTPENFPILKAEAYCFMPEVWTNYPDGKTTVRDVILPNHYEAQENRKFTDWTLGDDTVTVGNYPCKTATGELHGRRWTVRYTEEIPSSAGPWKLCGLPGLILKAETTDGIHRFTFDGISRTASPIYYEYNAITTKVSEAKLIKNRIKIFGNKHYPKNPQYYIPNRNALNGRADVTFLQFDDDFFGLVNGILEIKKAHVFQPLELK